MFLSYIDVSLSPPTSLSLKSMRSIPLDEYLEQKQKNVHSIIHNIEKQKQAKCPSTDEQVNKLVYPY